MDQFPPKSGSLVDLDDVKYVSRLSTILVATIEEAKDRISQIEYIFCSQLYPNVQSKYKNSQEVYLEAKKQAEEGWKEKERELLIRIEELERGKQEVIAENQSLKREKGNLLEAAVRREMRSGVGSGKEEMERIGLLEEQLAKKSAEVEEGMELSNRLIRMVQSKSTKIVELSVQLKEQQEKANGLGRKVEDLMEEIGRMNEEIAKHKGLEDKVNELERNLEDKTREVEQGRVLQAELQEQVGKQAHTIKVKMLSEDFAWNEAERVRKQLQEKLNGLEEKVNVLERDLDEKAGEVEKGRALQEELRGKIREQDDRLKFEVVREEYAWGEVEKVRKELQDKINGLEVKIDELERDLMDKTGEVEKGRLLQEALQAKIREQSDRITVEVVNKENVRSHFGNVQKELEEKIRVLEEKVKLQKNYGVRDGMESKKPEELLQQIQAKDAELVGEKVKNKDLVDAYKKLKHQYTYLCEKCGLTSENMLPHAKPKDVGDGFKRPKSPTISPELKTKDFNTSTFPHEPKKVKIEDGINDLVETDTPWKTVSNPSSHLPPPRSAAQKLPPTARSPSISGVKRPASGWIETRSGAQGKSGPDPHDDFLSTPLENLRANKNKAVIIKEEAADVVPAKADVNPCGGDNDSDDETQNMAVDPVPAKQDQALPGGKNGFKYVETVRKKAERESLKGVECKQCKKFYDAVLPENGGGAGGNNENLRCEHHDGVSRHRYRYAPPMTPEGFWNIGFESET